MTIYRITFIQTAIMIYFYSSEIMSTPYRTYKISTTNVYWLIQFSLRRMCKLQKHCEQNFGGPSAATAGTYIYQCALKGQWNEQHIQCYFERKVPVCVWIQQYSPSRSPYRFASLQHGLKSNQPRELQEENAQVKTLREL